MRVLGLVLAALALTGPISAATLERLTLDEMIEKSTEIVLGRVASSSVQQRGPLLYTVSSIQVVERWKGAPLPAVQVSVPGGTLAGIRQTFSGAPELRLGAEYVLFLWTGRSGVTHVIGFSQGVFSLKRDLKGQTVIHRAASTESLLDAATGQPVNDLPFSMTLNELRTRIRKGLAKANE